MTNLVATTQALYAAFGRGDIDAIVAHLADGFSWDDAPYDTAVRQGLDFMSPRRTTEGVYEFFRQIGQWTFKKFDVLAVAQSGNTVMSYIDADIAFPNGTVWADKEVHIFIYDDKGKVKSFRHFIDTASLIEASNGLRMPHAA